MLVFPVRRSRAESRESPAMPSVLVVDDNAIAADNLADWLRLDGYHVFVRYAEPHALDCAAEHLPDIAIVDIAMPERGGHVLARQLRDLLPRALIIAFSGFSGCEDVRQSFAAGVDEHWTKPLDGRRFSHALMCARRRHHAERRRAS